MTMQLPSPVYLDTELEIVGFDLGHGESALALAQVAATTEPQVLDLQPRKSFITAVAVHPKHGVLIGEDAYTARNLESLRVGFKSSRLQQPETREPTRLFVRKIAELLRQKNLIRDPQKTHFVVGCPSGWSPAIRAEYISLLREAGLESVSIVAESRAAFIYAREAQELRISGERLRHTVLIVDIGSSTTDFTAVHNLQERYIDFGDNALGAGMIDRAILHWTLESHERREELEDIFRRYPQYEAMCELKCRSVKEAFFSNEARWAEEKVSDTVKIPTPQPIFFDVEANSRDMAEILKRPQRQAQGWPALFIASLHHAREQMAGDLPELVFLTGGASRMAFTMQACRDAFPAALVLLGKEPDVALAKGLAWCGRIDRKTQAFRREMEDFVESDELRRLVNSALPQLYRLAARRLLDGLPTAVLPALREWEQGRIRSLADLQPELSRRVQEWLAGSAGREAFSQAISDWFAAFSPRIEEATNPICDRYGIPRAAFSLYQVEDWSAGEFGNLALQLNKMWDFTQIASWAIGIAGTLITASLAGGTGMALVAHGPVGWAVGLAAGAAMFAWGKGSIENSIKKLDLPLLARKLIKLESRMEENLKEKRAELETTLADGLRQDSEHAAKISGSVQSAVREHLNKAAEAVLLLIK
jgi:hypothetical protein